MDLLSQHEAFLRAIYDAPEDDTPRLVYADFLQENGDDGRAEFVRVQCEFAAKRGQAEHFDRLWDLAARQHELLHWVKPDRNAPAPADGPASEIDRYDRGFLVADEPLVITAALLADPVEGRWRIVRRAPELFGARALEVEWGLVLRPEQVDGVFALPVAQRVASWRLCGVVREELSHSGPGAFDLVELVQQPVVTTRGVEALAQHRGARRIAELDLRNNGLDNDAARALVRSPYLDNLKRLRLLEGNRLRGRVWQQVIERFGEDVVG